MSIRSLVPVAALVVAVAALYVSPLLIFSQRIGGEWKGILPAHIEDSHYYYARIHEVAEGNIFFGNPAYLEYREGVAPSWGLAEIFSAMPLILTGSWTFTAVFNILFWALFSALCIYATFRLLGISQWVSAIGAFFVSLQLILLTTRPVSMQVPYASLFLFVYTLILWISKRGYLRAVYLSMSSVVALMTYTFTGQIVACVLAVVALWCIVSKKWNALSELLIAGIVVSPLFFAYAWIVWTAIQDPFHFETLIRFGLVDTRLPMIEVYFYGRWLLLMVVAWCLLLFSRTGHDRFTVSSGVSLALMCGLFAAFVLPGIVGSDIESAVHIGRLVFPILAFSIIIFAVDAYAHAKKNAMFVLGVLCAVIVCLGIAKNIYDRNRIHLPPVDDVRKEQSYAPILSFIENQRNGTVVWAPDELVPYILVHTDAKVLFAQQGGLYSLPSDEQRIRYLVSRFPTDVTIESLVHDVGLYDLVEPKSYVESSLRIRPCWIRNNCEPIPSYVEYKGEDYFGSLKSRYENDIRLHISEYLDLYHVRFIVMPSGQGLDQRINARNVYTGEQYSLYERI